MSDLIAGEVSIGINAGGVLRLVREVQTASQDPRAYESYICQGLPGAVLMEVPEGLSVEIETSGLARYW